MGVTPRLLGLCSKSGAVLEGTTMWTMFHRHSGMSIRKPSEKISTGTAEQAGACDGVTGKLSQL